MNPNKELTLRALSQMRSDDLARARLAFRNCTPAQMKEYHVQSGKTRAQILAEYEAHDAKIDAAVAWVKSQS